MDTKFLAKYVTNKDLIALVDEILNQKEVYVIKYEYYKETDFKDRVFIGKNGIEDLSKYNKVDIGENFGKIKSRKGSPYTLEEHSRRVVEETQKILDSNPKLYDALDTMDFATMYDKEKAISEFKNICLVGAYLHDIGKALIGVTGVQIDDHSYVGGNYIYRWMDRVYALYDGTWYKEAVFAKLDNIIRWHMGFVIDKESKKFIAERRPDSLKQIETYIVSMADWKVNTPSGKRHDLIKSELEEFHSNLNTHDYKVSEVGKNLAITSGKIHLAIK